MTWQPHSNQFRTNPDATSMPQRQYGALPYRFTPDGDLQNLLITSRGSRRWVIPKGWPMQWCSSSEAAAQEAFEEAGVDGSIAQEPLGSYRYEKRLKRGRRVVCEVFVFPLHVHEELKSWPEQQERVRAWVSPERAASAVDEPGLAKIIRSFNEELQDSDADRGFHLWRIPWRSLVR